MFSYTMWIKYDSFSGKIKPQRNIKYDKNTTTTVILFATQWENGYFQNAQKQN